MEKRSNSLLLAIAMWLLLLLGIFMVPPGGAQTLAPGVGEIQWAGETFHRHQWKESEYGLHKKSESGIAENKVSTVTAEWRSHYPWQVEHPVLLVDICETCGLLRLHREAVAISLGNEANVDLVIRRGSDAVDVTRPELSLTAHADSDSPNLIAWSSAVSPWASSSRTCVLSVVARDGVEIGCLTPENRTYLHPSVRTVCNAARFRRNMRAAVKGSSKAQRYLESCAAKLSK